MFASQIEPDAGPSLPRALLMLRWGLCHVVWLATLLGAALAFPAVAAPDRASTERQFQAWLATDIWREAKAAGVSRATFDRAFAGVTLDWGLPDLQPPGVTVKPPTIEWQAEFRSPAPYFAEAGLKTLARLGRSRLAKWRKPLGAIEKRYGVPAEVIVAIWGKETSFGAVKLPEPAIRVLATQAFMGRRNAFFRGELVAALVILEHHDVAPQSMRSSLAGALGQPQFMPSLFLAYAVDFDGDGRRDIWNSVPDSLASIARFLAGEGWVRDRNWGIEARVPAPVACSIEGPGQGKPLAEWARLGITAADGAPIAGDPAELAYLMMPAGRFGPAFLVSDNFHVLKRYNNSDLYALYIGHLADRFADDRPFRGTWSKVGRFSRGDVKGIQEKLIGEGHDVGGADGLVGYKTRIAVGLAQALRGLAVTCLPDAALLERLR